MTELPDRIAVDPDDLTLDEFEEVERLLDGEDAFTGKGPKAKALKAIAFVSLRRDYPDITFEEVGKIRISALDVGDTGED
jgi:hypothetical protein